MNIIPRSRSTRSSALARRFLSLKIRTPQMNETMTELRLTSDTMDIMESGSLSEVKYAKSAMHMKTDIRGMAQLQWNGVVCFLCGNHNVMQMMLIMIIW